MFFNEFAEGNAHGLFHNARPVHMPADLKELCALVIIAPKTGKPRRPTPENGGRDSDRFNIVDGGWTTIKTGACRKWRLQARRSEEHTSELQSLMRISYAVFCLKKKKKKLIQLHNMTDNAHYRQKT